MARAITLLAALLAVACLDSPTAPDAVAGTPFDLRAGASAAIPSGYTLGFETVRSDSRCPMDAICVWAGEAVLDVSLKAASGAPEAREMSTSPGGSTIDYAAYRISLTSLAPYPRASQQTRADDYVATFVVMAR